jgi:hypothetical protein
MLPVWRELETAGISPIGQRRASRGGADLEIRLGGLLCALAVGQLIGDLVATGLARERS